MAVLMLLLRLIEVMMITIKDQDADIADVDGNDDAGQFANADGDDDDDGVNKDDGGAAAVDAASADDDEDWLG